MIELIKLYSNHDFFEEINFNPGINLILGEREETVSTIASKKTNGVGKSLSIEFLKFSLLAEFSRSRVAKIPDSIIPEGLTISLILKINNLDYEIERSYESPNTPVITHNNTTIDFVNLDDANKYLIDKVFANLTNVTKPSFREIMGPIIRDERSEFADIIRCYPITGNSIIPRNFKPHLFLFAFDLSTYNSAKSINKQVAAISKILSRLRKELTTNRGLKMTQVKSEINSLDSEVKKMQETIEELKTVDSFDSIQKDLVALEDQLDILRAKQKSLKHEINKIKSLPKQKTINSEDIKILYNSFKEGLGDQIQKSIEEVTEFKNRIESFQNLLLDGRFKTLKSELKEINSIIIRLDNQHSEKLGLIDNRGVLKNLKSSISIYNYKQQEHLKIRAQYQEFESNTLERSELYAERTGLILQLEKQVTEYNQVIQSFNETIVSIHSEIMGNSKASFEIKTIDKKTSKEVVDLDMRIDSDGSHSVEREKVFIYDLALMTNEYTRKRHLKFLVHDNIFEVDQDTLLRSLNYIEKLQLSDNRFQYIFTLNKDKLNFVNPTELKFRTNEYIVANFTKTNKFLKVKYQEE